jgi:hypothetical protein
MRGIRTSLELLRSDILPACRSRTHGQSHPGRLPQSRTSRPGRCCQTDKCSGSRPWTRKVGLSITIIIFKLISVADLNSFALKSRLQNVQINSLSRKNLYCFFRVQFPEVAFSLEIS